MSQHRLPVRLPGIALAWTILVATLSACSLPDIALPTASEPVDPPCVTIPPAPNMLGYTYQVADGAIWYGGCYNPANADEAAVIADLPSLSGTGHGLYRLNLRTGEKRLLFDGVTNKVPAWSRTGWILFGRGGEAWKIEADGDSVTLFTHTSTHGLIVETWNSEGNLVLCRYSSAANPQTGLGIYTAQGAFVRMLPDATIRAYAGIGWSPDGRRLAYAGGPNSPVTEPRLCLYDLTTNRLDTLDVLPRGYVGLSGMRWLPNGNEVVWGAGNGIGITNLQTRRTRLLRTNCSSGSLYRSYASPSPDGQQLLMTRVDYALSPTDPGLLLEKHRLETMSVQGDQLRQVTP